MAIFTTDWQATQASGLWRSNALVLDHSLPESPLFGLGTLAQLIETLPRQNYMLMHTGPVGTARKLWEEGEIGNVSGADVLEAIKHGNLWLLIRHVEQVSPAMSHLLADIYREIDANVDGGYATFNHVSDILISSPAAQVYYHFDQNGQTLWQVHGSKRVYVYPNRPPYLTREMLEYTAVYADETAVTYDPSYDRDATIYDLKAGQMIHWPLFSPHRIENLEFSVSYTTQYYSAEIRRLAKLHAANGIIHSKLPKLKLGDSVHGPSFAAKSLLQSSFRRLGIFDRLRQGKRSINFKLDPRNLGQIIPA